MNKYCYLLMVLLIVSIALCLPMKSQGQPILSNANDVSVTISWISNNETSGKVA